MKPAQRVETSKLQGTHQEEPKMDLSIKPNIKKIIVLVTGGIFLAIILVGIGWFFGRQATVQ